MKRTRSNAVLLTSAIALGALTAAGIAAAKPDSQLLGRTLVAGGDPDELALTFDDGPNGRSTLPLLELLERYSARATFFMIGKFVRERPDIVRAVHRAGHLVGNHSMTHPFLATKSARRIAEELRGCNHALEDVLGAPVRYFRAPHGARRPAVIRCAQELGLEPVQWNAQGNDWERIGPESIVGNVDKGLRRARRNHRGANVLLHDGFDRVMGYDRSATIAATDILLARARARNVRIVTVDAWS